MSKFQNYVLKEKVRPNSEYIKTKQNQKLEIKSFGSLKILYLIRKQAYKLDILSK